LGQPRGASVFAAPCRASLSAKGSRAQMDKITTTIKREWLKKIANRTKRVEYREIKPYWVKRCL
jgi:hypothetical protein